MNTPAVIPTLVDLTPPATCATAQLPAPFLPTGIGERGSAASLMKRHAEKQAQGLAPAIKPDKLPRSADDLPLSRLKIALRDVPPDKLLQQAQEAQDFPAACRRLRQAATCWGRDIAKEAAEDKRELTQGERKGIAFWACEASQAETALRVWYACNGSTSAAIEALENADMERFAAALRSGCYLSLGL